MRQTREQKRQEKLQSLAVLMGLVDRFGPGKRTEDQLRQEQVLSAQQSRQQQMALLPLLLEQQQLANRGASSDLEFAGERRPLELEQQRAILANMGLEQDYNQRTLTDRVGLVGSQAEAAKRANDFERATYNDRLKVSGQAPQLGQLQLKQSEQAIGSQRLQDEFSRQRLSQGQQEFPLLLDQRRAEIDHLRNPLGGLVGGVGGQPQSPMTSVDPSVMEMDQLFRAGVVVPNKTPEQGDYYRQMLPKLIDSINQNPGAGWSPESQAIKQYFDNGGNPLDAYDPSTGITEEQLRQILAPLQSRRPPPAKPSLPPQYANPYR